MSKQERSLSLINVLETEKEKLCAQVESFTDDFMNPLEERFKDYAAKQIRSYLEKESDKSEEEIAEIKNDELLGETYCDKKALGDILHEKYCDEIIEDILKKINFLGVDESRIKKIMDDVQFRPDITKGFLKVALLNHIYREYEELIENEKKSLHSPSSQGIFVDGKKTNPPSEGSEAVASSK